MLDGSQVQATVVASVPKPGAIAELLLQGRDNSAAGAFGRVTCIQRLQTTGGLAPAGGCTEGQVRGVRYTAEYRFFVAR